MLVKNNHRYGNLRMLVRLCLKMAATLRDNKECESNLSTWRVHNALFINRLSLKRILESHSESVTILQLDGSTTIPQITSLESQPLKQPDLVTSNGPSAINKGTSTVIINKGSIESSRPSKTTSEAGLKDYDVSRNRGDETNPILDSLAEQTAGKLVESGTRIVRVGGGQGGLNVEEIGGMRSLLSRQLVEGVVSLLGQVAIGPFTYDVHLEATNLLLVLLSSQVHPQTANGLFLRHILTVSNEQSSLFVHRLIQHVVARQPLPPHRSQGAGLLSSVSVGIWSLVTLSRTAPDSNLSPLADNSLLLLLVLAHQQAKGHKPYRAALCSFTDEHGEREKGLFCVSLEKLYLTICSNLKLTTEQNTLFLYLLLQSNHNVASFIFSRSDIEQLALPLLRQLHDCGNESSHHVYMLLIILLILSQDDCFNKSIHEITITSVPWYTERMLTNVTLGSLMVMVLVRTIQVNITQIRDKYLHTNCLAALANMSSHFHSLHLDAARKIVNLFKLLGKRLQKFSERLSSDPHTPSLDCPSPISPGTSRQDSDYATDRSILEEILQMVLEIINSCLTRNLHNNPHLIYSLLYEREVFEPYRSHPSLMDLVQNIETVVAFFSAKLEKSAPSPYSSQFVLDTILQASKAWPRNRLRVFPELKFRYVEEDQPEEFFIPYVWTLVFKNSSLYWDNSRIHFSSTV